MKKIFELINKNLGSNTFLHLFEHKKIEELPLITISREKGSGGRPIAYLVAKRLGAPWKVFHKIIIDEIAKEANLEKALIEEVDEGNIPLIEQMVDNVFGKAYMSLSSYYKHLIHILSTVGHRGHAVIIGRGANFLFPHALKVRIICEMNERIRKLMKYEKFTKKEAMNAIDESDRKRSEFTKSLFQHDQKKPHHYDLIVRIGNDITLEDAAELIATAAKRKFHL